MNEWRPLGTKRQTGIPKVGQTIGLYRAAWIVTHATKATTTDEEDRRLLMYKPEAREQKGPWNLSLRRIHGPSVKEEDDRREIGIRVPAGYWEGWQVYDEDRVPLCSCCNDPWPCLMQDSAQEAARAVHMMEVRIDRAAPGKCYACGEVITNRQQSMRYPEGNVELPGFPPPSFHLRNACADGQRAYERARAELLPEAPPVQIEEQTGRLL